MERAGTETGTVLETNGLLAKVVTNKSKACNECGKAQAGICGKKGDGIVMEVKNHLGAEKGDTVVIELEKSVHAKAYFIAFIFPIIALFIFAYIGSTTGIENLDMILGLSALVISMIFSGYQIHKIDKVSKLQITRVMSSSPRESPDCPEQVISF